MIEKMKKSRFFGYRLSSARMVIECAFGRLKARFGCLRRDMDINLDDLTYVIHSCFILHNFFEIHKEQINPQYVTAALKYDFEFQPPTHRGYKQQCRERQKDKKHICQVFHVNTLYFSKVSYQMIRLLERGISIF